MSEKENNKEKKSEIKSRFDIALNNSSTYTNCAGFVAYMLGKTDRELMMNTKELHGLLKEINRFDLSNVDINSDEYVKSLLTFLEISQVVGVYAEPIYTDITKETDLAKIIEKIKREKRIMHFGFIDPDDPNFIYQRADVSQAPNRLSIKDFIIENLDFYKDYNLSLVFFNYNPES